MTRVEAIREHLAKMPESIGSDWTQVGDIGRVLMLLEEACEMLGVTE